MSASSELPGRSPRTHHVTRVRLPRVSGPQTSSPTHRRHWRWARLGGGAAILAVLVLRLGGGPFLDGLHRVDAASLAAALAITAVTTVVSAWRWRLIARGLGLDIPLGSAVASYYRSQFLNSTLPGGVLGDVHRGLRQGQAADDVARGLRSVAWDRAAGQIVQVLLAVVTLLVCASPVRPALGLLAGGLVAVGVALALLVLVLPDRGRSWPARVARTVRDDVRAGLLTRRGGPAVFVASAVVVAGHVGVFLIAARTNGSTASIRTLLPLAMLVQLAMTVPTSIGGWGPREGVAAWAFSIAGLGADQGLATATVYGVLSLVATLPGTVVLARRWWSSRASGTVKPEAGRPELTLVGAGSGSGSGVSAHG
jgi:uncharacterized membrane protein YbhN (UPF0104 family)